LVLLLLLLHSRLEVLLLELGPPLLAVLQLLAPC
jgi:hypothetical protein